MGSHLKKKKLSHAFLKTAISKHTFMVLLSLIGYANTLHSVDDFKTGLVHRYVNPVNAEDDPNDIECGEGCEERKELPSIIEANLSLILCCFILCHTDQWRILTNRHCQSGVNFYGESGPVHTKIDAVGDVKRRSC